jgi:uncharacterized protein with gpF-like domain
MDKTDARLKALEKQIKSTYTKAYQEMKAESDKLLAKMQATPDMPMAQKMALMARHDRLNTLTSQLADTVSHANSMAERMINGEMVNVYEINYNGDAERLGFSVVDHSAVKKILTEEENPFNKINALHDKTAIKNKMKGELMTGLLKGESMQKIATRFKNVSEGYLKNAIRVARTETTRVQNSAKMDVGKHGEELGFVMMKRWVATTDHRVRDDHLAMNGVEVEQDEPFVLPDGTKMLFPCDISLGADAGQVINCRCTVVEFIKRDENGNLVMKGEEEHSLENMSGAKVLNVSKEDVKTTRGDGFTRVEMKNKSVDVAIEYRDDKTIFVDRIYLGETGTGKGTEFFENLVKEAESQGYSMIELMASGDRDSENNGYYTWARYGFDGDLRLSQRRQVSKDFGEPIKTVQELFGLKGGAEWWKQNGSTLAMEFDLSKGSKSRELWEEYLKNKKK